MLGAISRSCALKWVASHPPLLNVDRSELKEGAASLLVGFDGGSAACLRLALWLMLCLAGNSYCVPLQPATAANVLTHVHRIMAKHGYTQAAVPVTEAICKVEAASLWTGSWAPADPP